MIAARSSREVRAHSAWALRARLNASATSSSLDCGMCASGAPLSGVCTATLLPLVAISRSVRAATYSGSRT